MWWLGENVLELEGAELLIYHLPDDLVGSRHCEVVVWCFVVVLQCFADLT